MIRNVKLYPQYDSSGELTLKLKVWTVRGFYTASVPGGFTGREYEAKPLKYPEIMRKFPQVRSALIGMDESDWITSDKILIQTDNTEDFSGIGANLALASSLAVARASSENELWRLEGPKARLAFPYPAGSIIGGKSDWKEFMVIPSKARNPEQAARINLEIWKTAGEELKRKGLLAGRNHKNAWITKLDCIKILSFLANIAEDWDAKLGVDFSASSLWNGKNYDYGNMGKKMTPDEHFDTILQITEQYKLYLLEDPLPGNDFDGFAELNKSLPKALIAGDDLFRTSPVLLKEGIERGSANSIIINPARRGTLYQTFQVSEKARQNDIHPIASHGSSEISDDWLVDLSLLWKCPLIKLGMLGSDNPKQNRLIELWHDVPHNSMAELP